MKMQTKDLAGRQLDWVVGQLERQEMIIRKDGLRILGGPLDDEDTFWNPSDRAEQAYDIINREDISVIRLESVIDYIGEPDDYGDKLRVVVPVWGATAAGYCEEERIYGSQGDDYGYSYTIDTDDVVEGPTPLIAAMRAYAFKKLGATVDIPEELQ